MKKSVIAFGVLIYAGFLVMPSHAETDKKFQPDIEQLSYGAVQMFVAGRQIRLEQFRQAMSQVGPYISGGLTNMGSHKALSRRIEELANASRLANALAAMNGNAIPAMRLILDRHGESEEEIQAALPKLFGELEPSKNAILFAKYDVLFESIKGLYAYLDLHWEQWQRKAGKFEDKKLNTAYQRLISEVEDAINLMSEGSSNNENGG